MNSDTPKYYQPYESGEDTDDGSDIESEDYDSDDLPDFEDPRIRREEDPRYALIRTAGPNFNTSAQQLKYMEHAPGSIYDNSTNITSLSSLVYLNPPKTTHTSLFSVKSINRDTTVYTSPFNFSVKTPRVYKNVTKVQLVQISFPNNTAGFVANPIFEIGLIQSLLQAGVSSGCISTCVTLGGGPSPGTLSVGFTEKGRIIDNQVISFKASIPPGIYTKQQIADNLNATSNYTPPLNLISYESFKNEFKLNRDISILFNEPGEKFYSNVNKIYYSNHSKTDIMSTYFPRLYIDTLSDITDTMAFNAYHIPIIKELLATGTANVFLNTAPYSYEQVYDLFMNKFLGLDSNIYYNILQNNIPVLQSYRRQLTFEHNPVNKYIWSYDSYNKRFSVSHNCLHPSLQRDIINKYNSIQANEMSIKGLTARSFQTLKTNLANNKSVFNELQSNLSTFMSGYEYGGNYSYTGGLIHSTNLDSYSVTQLNNDNDFTTVFNYSSIFGRQFHSNFYGHLLNFNNFIDYHSTISSYYNSITYASNIISSIQGNVNYYHHHYVSTKYSPILPYSVINTKSYNNCQGLPVHFFRDKLVYSSGAPVTNRLVIAQTLADAAPGTVLDSVDPCIAECTLAIETLVKRYYGCLPINSIVADNPASLGYVLGISPVSFSNFESITQTFSFTSSINDNFNIFIQLNPELSMNNMDIGMKENIAITNETTGQVDLMAAKILLQGIGTGEVSETAIQNPIIYETPLGKLDRFTFKLYADDPALTPMWLLYPFDVGINEWDATFQIDEEVALANRNAGFSGNVPTIPIPNNPAAFQYMALTSSNNPLNK